MTAMRRLNRADASEVGPSPTVRDGRFNRNGHRPTSRRPSRALASAAALVACTATVVACGAGSNANSVTGSSGSSGHSGGSAIAGAPGGTPAAATTPGAQTPTGSRKWTSEKVSVGRQLVTELRGRASGVSMKVHVWLPPQYDDPANRGKRFPVLEVFPGGAGVTYTQWFGFGQPKIVAEGAKAGTITPFVIVEPQMQLSYAQDTECTDLPGQPKVGTFFEQDVPDLIKGSFNVLTQRQGWGVAGVSSGGYCAARLAMHRPDVFATSAVIDGYFRIDTPLKGADTPQGRATSPIEMIKAAPVPDVRMQSWFGTGPGNGTLSKARSNEFAAQVKPPMIFTEKEIPDGRHTWTTYQRVMPEVFDWFTRYVAKPSSGS